MGLFISKQYEYIYQFIERINQSTSIELLDQITNKTKITRLKILIALVKATFRSFIIHKNFKKGIEGFISARLEGIAALIRYTKIWEYQMRKEEGKDFLPPTTSQQIEELKQRYL